MSKIRAGIVGCGGIANGKHLPSIKATGEVDLVAFCDIVRERAEAACLAYGIEGAKVYEDYKELLKDDSIEAVYVCTPNRSHSFISIDALNAGKHVMCEKPMAKTYAEAVEMVEAAKRNRQSADHRLPEPLQRGLDAYYQAGLPTRASWARSTTPRPTRCAAVRYRPGAYFSTNTSRAAAR